MVNSDIDFEIDCEECKPTKIYGYVRVSTTLQDPALQVKAIKIHCKNNNLELVKIFKDTQSGKDNDRKEYQEMLECLKNKHTGVDALIVWKIDRLSRSQKELMTAIDYFRDEHIRFISVTEGIDTKTKDSRIMFSMFAIMADFERELIAERVQAGVDLYIANGGQMGRPRKELNMTKILHEIKMGVPKTVIAKNHGVCKATLYKALNNPDNHANIDPEHIKTLYAEGWSIRELADNMGTTIVKIHECLLPPQDKKREY